MANYKNRCVHLIHFGKFTCHFANRITTEFPRDDLQKFALMQKLDSMNRVIFLVVMIAAAAVCSFAQQRPLITDDVDITPPGSVEIAAGVDFFQDAKFPLSGIRGDETRVGDIRIRTGLAGNVEIQIEGTIQNYVAINSRTAPPIPLNVNGNSTNDFGDLSVAAKIKISNQSRHMPAFGMKFGFQIPNTDQAQGIGTNQINIFAKLLAQKKFGRMVKNTPKFNAIANIGIGIMTVPLERFSQNDVLLYGLGGIYRVKDNINIVGEINGRKNTRGGTAPLGTESLSEFRLGTQIRASGLRFDAAGVVGLSHFSPRTGIVFGVTYQSPSIFTPAK